MRSGNAIYIIAQKMNGAGTKTRYPPYEDRAKALTTPSKHLTTNPIIPLIRCTKFPSK